MANKPKAKLPPLKPSKYAGGSGGPSGKVIATYKKGMRGS